MIGEKRIGSPVDVTANAIHRRAYSPKLSERDPIFNLTFLP